MSTANEGAVTTPIVKVVTVAALPEQAFRRFTEEIATWWPLRTHSVGEERAESVRIEGFVGGRIVERIRGGDEAVWGMVTVWQPPLRVSFTWHPGDDPSTAQDVDVRFTAVGNHRTKVELTHSGFERLGAKAARARRAYPIGWTYVLGLYAKRRGPVMWMLGGVTDALVAIHRRRAESSRATLNR